MPMDLTEAQLRRRAENRRRLHEEVVRKKQAGGFQNGAEALQALRDVFGPDEELEAFGRHIRQPREEELARYRD
jgi:predicted Rdx family selenoprotein